MTEHLNVGLQTFFFHLTTFFITFKNGCLCVFVFLGGTVFRGKCILEIYQCFWRIIWIKKKGFV